MCFQPFCTRTNCDLLFSKSKTIKPVGFCLIAYLHLSPLTWPPLGQVGHGVEGACCSGWWMSSLLSPMWFCSAFFSMLLCTSKNKMCIIVFHWKYLPPSPPSTLQDPLSPPLPPHLLGMSKSKHFSLFARQLFWKSCRTHLLLVWQSARAPFETSLSSPWSAVQGSVGWQIWISWRK